jgi:hypothetical protein
MPTFASDSIGDRKFTNLEGVAEMTRVLIALIGLVAMVGLGRAEDKKADDRVKVEILLATEHLPDGLKEGTRVDLKMVTGKTVAPRGLTLYNTSLVAADVEVASVTTVEKPETPEAAVKVQLLVPKDLAEKVEKIRDKKVTVVESQGNGTVERKQKPVTLRLELPKSDKK